MSEDEGKSWKIVEDIPKGEALVLMEHPFENRYVRPAFCFEVFGLLF